MSGRGKASRGKGKGAPTPSSAATRKRKAEEADDVPVIEDVDANVEHEEDGEDGEVSLHRWQSPGESDWDDTPPMSLSTPDQLAVVVPLGTKQKIWAGGFVNLANFLPRLDDEGRVKLQVVDGDLVKKTTGRKITNKDDWSSAFCQIHGCLL